MKAIKRKNSVTKGYPIFLALCLTLLIGQGAYADTDVVKNGNKKKQAEKVSTVSRKAPAEKQEQETEQKAKYVYSPVGKTDPFVSFLSKDGAGGGRATRLYGRDSELQEDNLIKPTGEPETELETIDISELTLTAVIKGEQKSWAMVTDTKGRGYFLKEGTKIGKHSGFVDKIVCEEKVTDFGKETVKKVVIKIPYRNRDREVVYRSIEMELPYTTL